MKKRYLVLADGSVFQGWAFGADCTAVGELVFSTAMEGYVETLTDPSYCGQIVMQTFPLIGNYGVMEEDFEGKPWLRGYVVKEWCDAPSNFRCQYSVDEFLKRNNIPGLFGVDTRELTNRIREHGVVNAMLTDTVPGDLSEIAAYAVRGAVDQVTAQTIQTVPADGPETYHVVLIDYGAKRNIVRSLTARGCRVTVVPAGTQAAEILTLHPDGIMLSNGPGDPAENTACIETLKALLGRKPMFGICLGHQLLALACGGRTEKMKYGHRGGNQPCRDLETGRTYITSQNHGYAVVSGSVPGGRERFVNANDGTCEGLDYPDLDAFTVQFHPEACGGPKDTSFLFNRFLDRMGR